MPLPILRVAIESSLLSFTWQYSVADSPALSQRRSCAVLCPPHLWLSRLPEPFATGDPLLKLTFPSPLLCLVSVLVLRLPRRIANRGAKGKSEKACEKSIRLQVFMICTMYLLQWLSVCVSINPSLDRQCISTKVAVDQAETSVASQATLTLPF